MEIVNNLSSYFSYNSIVVISFFLICLVVLILNFITKNRLNRFLMLQRGSIFNPMLYIRLITSSCCHADFEHFKNNFMMILLIGPMIEEKYGSINLIYMFVITSVVTGIIHLIISNKPAVGASNIAFMLIGLSSIVNITDGKIPLTLILIVLFYIVDEIIKTIFHKRSDNVGHDAHLLGAICGILFGLFIYK